MINEELHDSLNVWNARLGAFIREGRRAKKLTQKELCAKLNITQAYLSYLENGQYNADFGLAVQICEILELDLNDLLKKYKN